MTHEEKLNIALEQVKALKKKAKKYLRDSRMVEDTVYKLMNGDRESEPKKLEVGKWYKLLENGSIAFLGSHDTFEYGISMNEGCEWIGYPTSLNEPDQWVEANPQEVKEALVKEAKRRGYKSGVTAIFGSGRDQRTISSDSITWEAWNDTMALSMGCDVIFRQDTGKWAEIIEQPVDKFAELKEAHKNGAVIQYEFKGKWVDTAYNDPIWHPYTEYRIKPEEKPKVGDVCKFWDDDENEYVVGVLEWIDEEHAGSVWSPHPYRSKPDSWYKNAKALTPQQVQELLFGKGVIDEE